MVFTGNPIELTSAGTSAILASMAFGLALYLYRIQRRHYRLKASYWLAGVSLMGLAGLTGGLACAFESTGSIFTHSLLETVNLWRVLTVAMFLCGVAFDLHGPATARRLVPFTVGVGLLFYLAAMRLPTQSTLMAIYATLVMLPAFIFYSWLATRFRFEGSTWLSLGAVLFIVAAWVQTSRVIHLDMIWVYDSYGISNLIRVLSLVALGIGLRSFLLPHKAGCDLIGKDVISGSKLDH